MKNDFKDFFSTAIFKNAAWLSLTIFGFYVVFNIFSFFKLEELADRELDKKIIHEIGHIDNFVDFDNDTLIFHTLREFEEEAFHEAGEEAYFLQIYTFGGDSLYESPNVAMLENYNYNLKYFENEYRYEFADYENFALRIIYKKLDGEDNGLIKLGAKRTNVEKLLNEFELFNLITLPIILLLIVAISLVLSRRVYSRLNKIINLANEISAHNISKRIEFKASKNDAYTKLKDTLNNLFDRLENHIYQISEFTDNASHQLMSPLTAIKSELDFVLKRERSTPEYVETLTILKEQTDNMIEIVRTLLILARESDNKKIHNTVFNLSKLVDEKIKPIYGNINIDYEITKEISLRGNEEYFKMVICNLIENAIKYSEQSDSQINVTAAHMNDEIKIAVADYGIGISDQEKNKIFEKFYRGKNTHITKGYGLGLSLAAAIVKQMGGSINVADNKPQGTIFHLTFPKIKFE